MDPKILKELLKELKAIRAVLQNLDKKTDPAPLEVKGDVRDELYPDVQKYVQQLDRVSTSKLQEKFGIGYARAATLIDLLVEQGFIRTVTGSTNYMVLLTPAAKESLEKIEAALKSSKKRKRRSGEMGSGPAKV